MSTNRIEEYIKRIKESMDKNPHIEKYKNADFVLMADTKELKHFIFKASEGINDALSDDFKDIDVTVKIGRKNYTLYNFLKEVAPLSNTNLDNLVKEALKMGMSAMVASIAESINEAIGDDQ